MTNLILRDTMYEKPELQRFGTIREMIHANFIQAGGCIAMGDGANPYHRYDGKGDLTCPLD